MTAILKQTPKMMEARGRIWLILAAAGCRTGHRSGDRGLIFWRRMVVEAIQRGKG
jgi:hypothetical protein